MSHSICHVTGGELVALIEKDLEALEKTERDFLAPPFLPRKPIPDLGLERIEGERFYSPEFMEQEWKRVWTKTWQLAIHETDLPEPGSFFVYEFGRESFLFTRDKKGAARGFYNICQHRGNVLCQAPEGQAESISCPFHGWEWNIDGTLKDVADPQFFRQFDNGIPVDDLGLQQVRTDSWAGFIWFNMDDNAMPLRNFLGEAGQHLESYELEKRSYMDQQSFEWKGNWKHAVDAFNESYHFLALHPDMVEFGEGHDVPIELHGIHSRMMNYNATVSELVDERDDMTPLREHMMARREPADSPLRNVAAKDVHLEIIKTKRAMENDTYLPYKKMNDEQLVHQYHYTFFPNTTFTQTPEHGVIFRYRPHATDPNICYYDFIIMAYLPPGSTPPDVVPETHSHGDHEHYAAAFKGTFDPILANVLRQDGSNMETMQRGVKSKGFKGMILCDQEIRLRHFHQTIDQYISGEIDPQNPPV
jgi:phenylpropionate dioxygenase-like ring-hydroxylating dioxygenase large terminal subunit